jgi:hypothetical protein
VEWPANEVSSGSRPGQSQSIVDSSAQDDGSVWGASSMQTPRECSWAKHHRQRMRQAKQKAKHELSRILSSKHPLDLEQLRNRGTRASATRYDTSSFAKRCELCRVSGRWCEVVGNGRYKTRTCDLHDVNVAL